MVRQKGRVSSVLQAGVRSGSAGAVYRAVSREPSDLAWIAGCNRRPFCSGPLPAPVMAHNICRRKKELEIVTAGYSMSCFPMLLQAPRAPHSRRRKTSKAAADGSAAGRFASAAKGESRRLLLPVLNDPPTFRTVPPGSTSMFWRRKKVRDRSKELQSEFLKNLNHHIRNPLNAIVLLTDLLIQTVRADEEEIHSALLTIARASSHLE